MRTSHWSIVGVLAVTVVYGVYRGTRAVRTAPVGVVTSSTLIPPEHITIHAPIPTGDITISGGHPGANMPASSGGWIKFKTPSGYDVMSFSPLGDIYVRGHLIERDQAAVDAFRGWLMAAHITAATPLSGGNGGDLFLH